MMRILILAVVAFMLVIAQAGAQKNAAEKIYPKVNNAIVSVLTYHDDGSQHGQASGVVLKSRGWIITNFHVFGDATSMYAIHYGRKLKLDSVIRADKKNDILIITIDESVDPEFFRQMPDIKIADMSKLRIGQSVYAIGSPLGLENSITDGIISGMRVSPDSSRQFIQISAPFSPGSSGGAAVNTRGELIGITTFRETDAAGSFIGFVIPINDVLNFDPVNAVQDFHQQREPDAMFQTGLFEYQKGHYRQAMQYIAQSQYFGLNEEYFADYIKARCYEGLDRNDSAMIFYKYSIIKNPDYADAYLGISRIYMQEGEMEMAMEYQQKAYSLDPTLRERKPE